MHLTCSCPTESISKYHYLTYIHVPFQLHAGPLHCISLPYRSQLSSIQTQPGFNICISSASSSCPTLIKVRRMLYHPHPCTISLSSRSIDSHFTSIPSRLCLNSIQATQISVSHPSRLCLTSIQVSVFTSHLQRGDVLPPSRSRKLHLISAQVQSETHPGLDINSIHALPHLHWRPKTSCLTYIHVPTNHIPCPGSPIHLGCILTQSRSLYLCLTSIYETPHFHQGPQIRISIPHLQFKCWELPPASI